MKKITKVFVPSTKVIVCAHGKTDFFKSTKDFRDRVQMFADGINKMTDTALVIGSKIEALKNTKILLEGIASEEDNRKYDEKIRALEEERDGIYADIKASTPEYNDTDKNLYHAYYQYFHGEITEAMYNRAFMEWFDMGGLTPAHDTIKTLMDAIGERKATKRELFASNGTKFTSELKEKPFYDMVYRKVATLMYDAKALKPFTYTYVAPVKEKKNPTK